MSQELNQDAFVSLARNGQRDFSKNTFVGNIDASLAGISFDQTDTWIFNDSTVTGELFLGDITAQSVSFEYVGGNGKICLYRPCVNTIHARKLVNQRFTVINGTVDEIDLSHSEHGTGFMIKETPLDILILDHSTSLCSLFDEESVRKLTTIGASLGRRIPMTLAESLST